MSSNPGTSGAVVEARGLAKNYGKLEAVRGIDLSIAPGEVFGFLGPNGAGKSTTISILCTLLRPTGGQALVAGIDVARDPGAVRSRIGLVFQDPSLDDQLTARENLEFHAFLYNVPRADRRERIDGVLDMVELTERADSQVRTFSGGMKRRLEIARGILHYPQVLFLDEPTLGLDPQTRNRIWAYLHDLRRREGITLFMTTHYMDEAEFCDRIAIIDHGQIIALGSPDELKAMVGGDVITITTKEVAAAADQVRRTFEMEPIVERDRLTVEVQDGAAFVPRLMRELTVPITAVTLSRPRLDDVFLKLTGKAIRDEGAGEMDQMRTMMSRWSRAGGRR
jgi:ABC-2 type transport system ATP-binding protein